MPNPAETKSSSNNTFLSYEIYDYGRFKLGAAAAGTIAALALIGSCIQSEDSTGLAVKCGLSLLMGASALWMFLRAEDRAVKDARAGYRVFNAFRGTYSEGVENPSDSNRREWRWF